MQGHDIFVIGASAGGLEPLLAITSQLPANLNASIFIVKHVSADAPENVLMQCLTVDSKLKVRIPEDGEVFLKGHIYVAPPGRHMLLKGDKISVTRGPRENGQRPSIDALFRSAAAQYGNRVVGIVLSGLLYDGCAGMEAIKRSGGCGIVQNPQEATYADMPKNTLDHVRDIDYVLPAREIARVIVELSVTPIHKNGGVPEDIIKEAKIAERVLTDIPVADELGERSQFTCPDCGGVLWEMKHTNLLRYRCHTGHTFTAKVYLREQSDAIEEVLWVAMRLFGERKMMFKKLLDHQYTTGSSESVSSLEEKMQEADNNIERIRNILMHSETKNENMES
ncbi:MAG: chemotaxis protein CheB [Sphingobacteriales bacterium]|nr:MAG: chemotaxis protein CheB [Sphingobacteriales bacterium]